jgi:pimeloyl-ACP methyl ester carboxylesterase
MRVCSSILTAIALATSLPAALGAPLLDLDLSLGFNEGYTVAPSRGTRTRCVTGTITINATTTKNIRYNFDMPENQTVITNTFLKYITPGGVFQRRVTVDEQAVGGTYSIGATLCVPAEGTSPIGVQIATHGVGFDRSYWDFAPGYSYVDTAAQYGYATFFYDRLGVGTSSKPDGIQIVQAPLETAILHQLVGQLRSGGFNRQRFNKIVGVGHSFGSILTQAVAASHPNDFDALVLTGFGTDGSGVPAFLASQNFEIASQNQPFHFRGLSNAYVLAGSATSVQYGFFRAPNYDNAIFDAAVAARSTATLGEFFSLFAVTGPAANYTKPVAVVNGQNDFPFCQNNCSAPVDQAQLVFPRLFPALPVEKQFAYLAPGTGHALNLHYTAQNAFVKIQEFLKGRV